MVSMKLSNNVVFGELAASRKGKIQRAIKHNKPLFDVYMITTPIGADGILEIYPYNLLKDNILMKQDMTILGIGYTKDEAILVVSELVTKCYKENGDFQILKYCKEKK